MREIYVSTEHYVFSMNKTKPFGRGRYTDSYLKQPGWLWWVDHDEDIDAYIYFVSRGRVDLKPFFEKIDDETFEILREDLLKTDTSGIVQIVLGWRYLENLRDYIHGEIESLVSEGEITEEEEEELYEIYLPEYLDKLFVDIVEDVKEDIKAEIKKTKNIKDLVNMFQGGTIEEIVWEATVSIVADDLASNIAKVRRRLRKRRKS